MRLGSRRLFLGRRAYRRRRMIDATRIVPVAFALLVLVPPIWRPQVFSFATGALWLALGWLATIIVTATLHHVIGGTAEGADEDDDA
ncbi:MAG TPA: hypothetical protein VNQ78_07080 [Paracoccus sp. (in: a-proteobacteria)]|uniref:hypothetical protein n=1 Tax=Paracoccus sp. TaxID=267 RepID=UPI002C9A5941|nr:hypothetical protein [Paracoccus sp. (in: a-proteobacteria)]HWL56428.1 hypothetical protein [Paracoccus sp. (in: a-proteobacteria)]